MSKVRAAAVTAVASLVPLLTGCGVHYFGSSAPPPPAGSSATASTVTVTGTCTMGWEWTPSDTAEASGQFNAGSPPPGNDQGDPALAYQVTLTNGSGTVADVAGVAVAFYSSGTEDGSDQAQATGFITPGQSLTWAVIEDRTVGGYGDDPNQRLMQTGAIPAGADSCQFLEWFTG